MRHLALLTLASSFLVSLGCSGSSGGGGGSCGSFTPCGGSLVGTWHITGTCFTAPDAGATSPCSSAGSSASFHYEGTLTFRNDGTYATAVTMSGTSSFTYTSACLSAMGMSCAEVGASLSVAADGGFSGACSASGNDCTCTATINKVESAEQGTYSASGTSVVTTSSDSSSQPSSADYCVQGNRLTIGSKDSGGAFAITATK